MATQQVVTQALEEIPQAKSLIAIVQEAAKEVKLNPVHLVRIAATQIRLNPKLAQCTPASFVGALIGLEQVDLEPVAGRAYILPFMNNRKVGVDGQGKDMWRKQLEAQMLIGYQGYSDLFYRHEKALTIQAHTVHKNDKFDYIYGTEAYLRHKPAEGDRGPATHYYTLANMTGGAVLFLVMTKEECLEHGKRHSKVYDKKKGEFMPGTPWVTDQDSMCKKTTLLQLKKNLPLSIETQKALSLDETTREYRPGINSMMDVPDITDWREEEPIDTTVVPETKKNEVSTQTPQTSPPPPKEGVSPLPENIQKSLKKAIEKVGDKIYKKVIGQVGYGRWEELPSIPEANKFLDALGEEWTKSQDK